MVRASNGAGTIRQRQVKSGKVYDVQVTVRDARSGLSRRVTKGGFKTKKDALAWRTKMMAQSDAGQLVSAKPLMVPELVRKWLDRGEVELAPSSRQLYERILQHHVAVHLNIRVDKLSAAVMQQYFRAVQVDLPAHARGGRGVMRTSMQMVRGACRWGARSDVNLLARNPLEGVTISMPVQAKKRRPLDVSEFSRLLQVSEGKDSHLLWWILGTTGMRHGEATALSWGDVDLNVGSVSVTKINAPEKSGTIVNRVKAHSARVIPLTPDLKRALIKVRLARGAGDDDLLFPSTRALGPIRRTAITKWWQRDCIKAGIKDAEVHSLRHMAATLMLDAGVSVNVVAEILGHSTPVTTITIYGHSTRSAEVAAVASIAEKIAEIG